MKKNSMLIAIVSVIAILMIGGGAIYWFQIKPSQIKKECKSIAESVDFPRGSQEFIEIYNRIYEGCLKDKGL